MEDLGATCHRGAKRCMILELMRQRNEHIGIAEMEAETCIEILKNFRALNSSLRNIAFLSKSI